MGLGRGVGARGGRDSSFSLLLGNRILWRCQIYILQGLSRGKWVNLYQIEKIQSLKYLINQSEKVKVCFQYQD